MENPAQAAGDFGRVEYRIIQKTRYIVTRFEEAANGSEGSVSERGSYDNPDLAWEVGYALCKQDHDRMDYPLGDERIRYPEHPHNKPAIAS